MNIPFLWAQIFEYTIFFKIPIPSFNSFKDLIGYFGYLVNLLKIFNEVKPHWVLDIF